MLRGKRVPGCQETSYVKEKCRSLSVSKEGTIRLTWNAGAEKELCHWGFNGANEFAGRKRQEGSKATILCEWKDKPRKSRQDTEPETSRKAGADLRNVTTSTLQTKKLRLKSLSDMCKVSSSWCQSWDWKPQFLISSLLVLFTSPCYSFSNPKMPWFTQQRLLSIRAEAGITRKPMWLSSLVQGRADDHMVPSHGHMVPSHPFL